MSLIRITTLILACTLIQVCEMTEYDRFAVVEKREDIIACGSRLADLLADVCIEYNQRKRDYTDSDDSVLDSDYYFNYETHPEVLGTYAFKPKRSVSTMFRTMRLKRGLVDECCKKPCTMDVIKLYCK